MQLGSIEPSTSRVSKLSGVTHNWRFLEAPVGLSQAAVPRASGRGDGEMNSPTILKQSWNLIEQEVTRHPLVRNDWKLVWRNTEKRALLIRCLGRSWVQDPESGWCDQMNRLRGPGWVQTYSKYFRPQGMLSVQNENIFPWILVAGEFGTHVPICDTCTVYFRKTHE